MKGLEGNHNLIIISGISEIKMADSNFFHLENLNNLRMMG